MATKLKVAQIVIVSGVLAATGAEIMARDPADVPHTEADTHVPQTVRLIATETSGTFAPGFIFKEFERRS